jgi:hypothetical protein
MAVAGSPPRSLSAFTSSSGDEETDSCQQGDDKQQIENMVEQDTGLGDEAEDEW